MKRIGLARPFAARIPALAGAVLVSVYLITTASADAAQVEVTRASSTIELAQAFTTALNLHDVDAVVTMFTDEDSGPTINADRHAWQKFEIRLWVEQQVAAGIWTEAYDYRTTEHGATWSANVHRDDWAALGMAIVPVTNSIWVHNGQLADFSSTLTEPRDVQHLGDLWRPGAPPDSTPGA
jgi:hypothetical protein